MERFVHVLVLVQINFAQDRDRWWTLVSAVMNLRVPWNAGNFLTSCKPVSCSGRALHHGVSKEQINFEAYCSFNAVSILSAVVSRLKVANRNWLTRFPVSQTVEQKPNYASSRRINEDALTVVSSGLQMVGFYLYVTSSATTGIHLKCRNHRWQSNYCSVFKRSSSSAAYAAVGADDAGVLTRKRNDFSVSTI